MGGQGLGTHRFSDVGDPCWRCGASCAFHGAVSEQSRTMQGEGKKALNSPFGERGVKGRAVLSCRREPGLFSAELKLEQGRGRPDTPSPLAGGCLCAQFMHNRSSEERDTVSLLQIQFQLDE